MFALADIPIASTPVSETDELFRLQHRIACRADELARSVALPGWLAWLQAEREILGAVAAGNL
jgi:hypothetical protein